MNLDKLIYMANQIAHFFAHEGADKAPASIADHLTKFWDPRMRRELGAAVAEQRAPGLDALALAAIRRLPPVQPRKA